MTAWRADDAGRPGDAFDHDDAFAHDDALYLMGALSPEEEAAYEEHLLTCGACAEDVAYGSALVPVLAALPPNAAEVVLGPRAVPVSHRAPREPRPELRRAVLAAGGVAACVAAVGIGVVIGGTLAQPLPAEAPPAAPQQPTPTEALALQPVGRQPLAAVAELQSVRWGTRIRVVCEWAGDPAGVGAGDPAGPAGVLTLVVRDGHGGAQQVATWNGLPGEVTVPAATSLRRDDIATLEVRAADGRLLLAGS